MSEFEQNLLYYIPQDKLDEIKLEGVQPRLFEKAIEIAHENIPQLSKQVIEQIIWSSIYDWQRETGHKIAEVRLMQPENQRVCMLKLGQNFQDILLNHMHANVPKNQVAKALEKVLIYFDENFMNQEYFD